ncbi:GntR family transcriptional regulator [Streptomyces sp. NPDC047315]|uniref:GntR family transcriptional regulator n=1 Tax=Streptomyces sp. NPDC047315 TaxID=3155142 RepID=UPI00340666C7
MPTQPGEQRPQRRPGDRHKYREVADDLRRRIGAGEFAEKGRLPAERTLQEQYELGSQVTIRQALAVLRDEGLVESRVGSGWRITTWRPIVRNATKRLRSEQWSAGRSMWDVDIDDRDMMAEGVAQQMIKANTHLANTLGITVGDPVWERDRRYLVDGVPVMHATSHIPFDLAQGTRILERDSGPGGVYARLGEIGSAPVQFREQMRSRLATPDEVDVLKLAAGAPVIEQYRTAKRADGRVVACERMILDASRFLLVYDFPA